MKFLQTPTRRASPSGRTTLKRRSGGSATARTTPVFRAYASMSGTVTFESARRPPIGRALPDSAARPEGSPHLFQPSTFNFLQAWRTRQARPSPPPNFQHSTFNLQLPSIPPSARCAPARFRPGGESRWGEPSGRAAESGSAHPTGGLRVDSNDTVPLMEA